MIFSVNVLCDMVGRLGEGRLNFSLVFGLIANNVIIIVLESGTKMSIHPQKYPSNASNIFVEKDFVVNIFPQWPSVEDV